MTAKKNNLNPWEKQDHETSKAYAAFCAYRDMGPYRSFAKIIPTVYGQVPGSKVVSKHGQLSAWSVKYNWVVRVEAYDVYLEEKKRYENEEAIKEMAKQHAELAVTLRSKAFDRIEHILEGTDDEGLKTPSELTPREALEYIKEAVKIERISRGAPDQMVEHSGTIVQIIDNIPNRDNNKPAKNSGETD